MKLRSVIILSLLIMVCGCTKADKNHLYPRYNVVISEFYYNYQFENENEDIKFIKNKSGWAVSKTKYENGKEIISDVEPFWDRTSGKFLQLQSYSPTIEIHKISKIKAAENYCAQNSSQWFPYDRCPYYGYIGWDKDVISDFGNTDLENLSDTILEGLARAYTTYADGYMWHQYGQPADSFDRLRTKIEGLGIPNDIRIDSFLRLQDKSIEIYKYLSKKNPHYETLVGNIEVKYFNELFFTYSALEFCGKETLAQKYISQCQLDECYLNSAKNFLNSLEPNAIIFTNGDNDTYLLLFLQNKMGYRKDVTVINNSLLAFIPYIEYLKSKKIVDLVTLPAFYLNEDRYWAQYVKPETEEIKKDIPIMGLLLASFYLDNKYSYYTQKNAFIEHKNGNIPVNLPDYIGLNDRLALDIIQGNIDEKPIYFTYKPTYMDYDHLLYDGIVIKLTEKNSESESMTQNYIDRQVKYLSDTFLNPFTNKRITDNSFNSYCFANLFRLYNVVCNYYEENNQKNKATEVMGNLCNYFKERPYPYYNNFPSVVNLLYRYNHPVEAQKYSDKTIEHLHKYIFKPDFQYYEFITDISQRLNGLKQIEITNGGDITQINKLLQEIQDFTIPIGGSKRI